MYGEECWAHFRTRQMPHGHLLLAAPSRADTTQTHTHTLKYLLAVAPIAPAVPLLVTASLNVDDVHACVGKAGRRRVGVVVLVLLLARVVVRADAAAGYAVPGKVVKTGG